MNRSLFLALFFVLPASALAQVGDKEISVRAPMTPPNLESMLGLEPLLTTSLTDARTGVPFLDKFNPSAFASLARLPGGRTGGFLLVRPGAFQQHFQGYCLSQGDYGPAGGKGFLYAPLRGPQADLFRCILHGAGRHPEVPQRKVQHFLWDLLPLTGLDELEEGVAEQLLAKEELAALKKLTEERRDEVLERLPGFMARVRAVQAGELGQRMQEVMTKIMEISLRAQKAAAAGDFDAAKREGEEMKSLAREMENLQIRWMAELTGRDLTMEERERHAVLQGEHEPGPGSREVPEGRWSYHPDGFFIRYFSSSYDEVLVQLYVARPIDIKRDARGRIVSIADRRGNRIETDYDDNVPAVGAAGMRGEAFRSIRFMPRVVLPPEIMFERHAEWNEAGWTLSGLPAESAGGIAPPAGGRFTGLGERCERARRHLKELQSLEQGLAYVQKKLGTPLRAGIAGAPDIPETSLEHVMDLAHYTNALEEVIAGHPVDESRAAGLVDLARQAWGSALTSHLGGWIPDVTRRPRPSGTPPSSGTPQPSGAPEFDPGDGVAVPGDTSEQRLGVGPSSPEEDEEEDPCDAMKYERAAAKAIRDAFQDTTPRSGESVDDYLNRVNDQIMKNVQEMNRHLQDQGIPGRPGKPYAPMGTSAEDGRIAPGGPPDDPSYAEDWKVYDNSTPEQFEEYIKNKYYADDPDSVWDSHREHEQQHLDDAASDPDGMRNALSDPAQLRAAELRAYDRQIKFTEDWIEENCP